MSAAVSSGDGAPGHRRLLLLRHAKAVTGPGTEAGDHARDLSERGRNDARVLGETLHRLELRPGLILLSSALRTRRTWEMLALSGDPPPLVTIADRFYLAEPEELLGALREIPDGIGLVMLIGHNPGLHELSLHLAGDNAATPPGLRAGMPTCSLVMFEIDGGWRDLQPRSVRNIGMIRP